MDTKLLKRLGLILLCGSMFQATQAVAETMQLQTQFLLGDGYQSSSGILFPTCLVKGGPNAAQNTSINNPKGTLTFTQVQSLAELSKILKVGGSLTVTTLQFSGSAEGNYINSLDTSSKTIHILYVIEELGYAILNLQQDKVKTPTDMLLGMLGDKYNTNLVAFEQQCGNSYIGRANVKAAIVVDIAIKFTSNQALEAFDAKIKADVNAGAAKVGVTGALNLASTDKTGGASITFKAQQFGGNPALLANSLTKVGAPAGDGTNASVVDCGSGKDTSQKSCDAMMQNVINYGATLGDQLKDQNGNTDYTKYYYSDPVYYSYATLLGGPDDTKAIPAKMLISEMVKRFQNLQNDIKLLDEYSAIIGVPPKTLKVPSGFKRAEAYSRRLNNMLGLYNNATMEGCLKKVDETLCKQALDIIKAGETGMCTSGSKNEECDMLNRIKNNNFDLPLLTLYSPEVLATSTPPQFQKMTCTVVPIGSGRDNSVRVVCPNVTDQSQELTFQSPKGGMDLSASTDAYGKMNITKGGTKTDFVYSVTDGQASGGKKYCFLYQGGITVNKDNEDGTPNEYGEYTGTANVKYLATTEANCPAATDSRYKAVTDDDMGDGEYAGVVDIEQQALTTYYPNIMGL